MSNPPHEAHGNFVIVDEAKGLFFTDNEEGWVANGQARRVPRRDAPHASIRCTSASAAAAL